MKSRNLSNLRAKSVTTDKYGFVIIHYKGFEIWIQKNSNDGTYQYYEANHLISGSHYHSLAAAKTDIRAEVKEIINNKMY